MLPNRKRNVHQYIRQEYGQENVKTFRKWKELRRTWWILKIIQDFH